MLYTRFLVKEYATIVDLREIALTKTGRDLPLNTVFRTRFLLAIQQLNIKLLLSLCSTPLTGMPNVGSIPSRSLYFSRTRYAYN